MAFAVFDVETRVDKHLLNQVYFAGQGLSDSDAFAHYREDLRRRRDSDFFPLTLHLPISIAVGNVGDDYVLREVESLAVGDYSEEKLVSEFWSRAERFAGTLVSFNGRRFDIPVLELAALRHGIAAPAHFADDSPARDRHSSARHVDLYDYLTNFGAVSLTGGMDLLMKMLGLPGKTTMDGSMVQEYFEAGRLDEIHRYCRNDVVQTYFLFLRVALMRGDIDEDMHRAAAEASHHFLVEEIPPSKKIA
ncbi:MAG TPA: ribonuclease H-like domain-containing protein [Candidatus Binataceae bacterium]|nr:ribonuclease H-like domain-containing protein [Candidatus Binataceae bacterium]